MKQIVLPSVIVGGNPAKLIRQPTNEHKKIEDFGKTADINLAHESPRGFEKGGVTSLNKIAINTGHYLSTIQNNIYL